MEKPNKFTVKQLKEISKFIKQNLSHDNSEFKNRIKNEKLKPSKGKAKTLKLKLEKLKLYSEENIEIYKYLPITHFDNFELNFMNLQEDKFDTVCEILREKLEKSRINYELKISFSNVTLECLFNILNSLPKIKKVFIIRIIEWNTISRFDKFTYINFDFLKHFRLLDIHNP